MAKINVFEDSISAVKARYEGLLRNHNVTLYFINGIEDYLNPHGKEELESLGFKVELLNKFQVDGEYGVPETDPRHIKNVNFAEADIHFVDGLKYRFWSVLPCLPKDRVYLSTGNPEMASDARRCGYKTIDPREIVESIDELLSGIRKD